MFSSFMHFKLPYLFSIKRVYIINNLGLFDSLSKGRGGREREREREGNTSAVVSSVLLLAKEENPSNSVMLHGSSTIWHS